MNKILKGLIVAVLVIAGACEYSINKKTESSYVDNSTGTRYAQNGSNNTFTVTTESGNSETYTEATAATNGVAAMYMSLAAKAQAETEAAVNNGR